MIPRMLTPREAGVLLNVRPAQIWRWCRAGKLRALRFGRGRGARIRVPEDALLEFLGAEPENPALMGLSATPGTVPGASMSRKEALGYLTGALKKGRMT